jgi:hypothetical protein
MTSWNIKDYIDWISDDYPYNDKVVELTIQNCSLKDLENLKLSYWDYVNITKDAKSSKFRNITY